VKDALWRLVHLEPALFRGIILAVVGLLGTLGIVIAPQVPDSLLGFLIAVLALVQAIWTRQAVTPNAKVAVSVPDPVNAPQTVAAGDAVTTATSRDIVSAARSSGDTNDESKATNNGA